MAISARKKRYQAYLQSEHWKQLKEAAIKRDKQCVACGEKGRLQVHHKLYREKLEEGILEDVETLCRTCHRVEHGLWVMLPLDRKLKELKDQLIDYDRMPSKEEEKELVSLIQYEDQVEEVEAFFRHLAGMRIILSSRERWASFLNKSDDVKRRLWPWARAKLKRLESELYHVG